MFSRDIFITESSEEHLLEISKKKKTRRSALTLTLFNEEINEQNIYLNRESSNSMCIKFDLMPVNDSALIPSEEEYQNETSLDLLMKDIKSNKIASMGDMCVNSRNKENTSNERSSLLS
jgi:hypothetical protein